MTYSRTRKVGQSLCQVRLWYLVFRYVSALYSFRDIPESCNTNLLTDKGSVDSETSCFRFTYSIFFFEERVFPVQFLRDPRIMQHWWSLRFLNFGQGLLQLTCFYIVLREECRFYRLRDVPEKIVNSSPARCLRVRDVPFHRLLEAEQDHATTHVWTLKKKKWWWWWWWWWCSWWW